MSYDQVLLEQIKLTTRGKPPMPYYFHNIRTNPSKYVEKFLRDGIVLSKGPAFDMRPPIDWGAEKSDDREWQVLRNAFFPVDWTLQAFIETGQEKYLQLTVSILADWATYNIVENRPNRIKWSDICTGLRGFYYAFVIDQCARTDSLDDHMPLLVQAAAAHARELSKPESIAKSNHAIFQALGLAALAEALSPMSDSESWMKFAHGVLLNILQKQYGAEGVHLEHSPYYHGWVWQRLSQVATKPWFDGEKQIGILLNRAAENYVHFFHPDGSLSELGDSSPDTITWVKDMHPYAKFGATKEQEGARPPSTNRRFGEAGYVVFRDSFDGGLGQSALIAACGHHSGSHKHDDDFTFEWSDFGRLILVDSGKYSYDHNEDRDYVLSRRAHNVVEIDNGEGFSPKAPYGSGVDGFQVSGALKYARFKLPRERLDVQQFRELFICHGAFLLVVDHLEGQSAHEYKQWFHFPADVVLNVTDQRAVAQVSNLPSGMLLNIEDLSGKVTTIVQETGIKEPRLQGWISPDYGKLVPAPSIGLMQSGDSAVYATLFWFSRGASASVTPIKLEVGLTKTEISFAWPGSAEITTITRGLQGLSISGPCTPSSD